MARIRILPDQEADRIAAGEIVERPASVARELVENALDAGAARVEVELGRGGLERIRISDDGEGMEPEDVELCLQRHATSKIRCLEDLQELSTLGFRGEALPSIASVSRLEILTARRGARQGTRAVVEAGDIRLVEPAARAAGTTVTVRDLFYNTPARKKFLRSPSAEFSRVSEILLPEMLARPAVAFRLMHEDREAVNAPPSTNLPDRMASLWGAALAARMQPFRHVSGSLSLHGFVSGAEDSRGTRRSWYLFVNGRPVKDRLLTQAATEGLSGALPRGRFPVLVLFLDCPGDEVDVNVHPAKSEVRFTDPRNVFRTLAAGLSGVSRPGAFLAQGPVPVIADRESAEGWNRRPSMAEAQAPSRAGRVEPGGAVGEGAPPAQQSFTSTSVLREPDPTAAPLGAGLAVLAQYRQCFIVAHDGDGLFLIDQHCAHERILYEEVRTHLAEGEVESQSLLFPRTLELEGRVATDPGPLAETLERFGFGVESFGPTTLAIRQAPAYLPEARIDAALRDLADDLDAEGGGERDAEDRLLHRLAATIACHAAVKINFTLTPEKMTNIVERLFRCKEPLTCPHGRRSIVRWPHDDILKAFGRPVRP